MDETYLIGIDLGVTGARVTAYDTTGNVVLSDNATIDRQTVSHWEQALREAAVYLPTSRLVCSVVGTSGTIVAVDRYGEPVFDPQMYYESAEEQADKIQSLDSIGGLAERGLSISASSPLPKILQLREEHPGRFKEVEWILSPSTWLLYRLQFDEDEPWRDITTDWTSALKFGADITATDPVWFEPLFEESGVSLDLFPDIEAPGTYLGIAKSSLAEDLGLEEAELYHGMTDGNASALASGCLEPDDYSISCGSDSLVKYVVESIDPHEALYYHRHPIEGYLAGAALETGAVLQWFCECVLGIGTERGLRLARMVDPGDEYRFYLQGNRSPFFNPGMANSFMGIWPDQEVSKEEVRGRFLRGIAVGVAFSEYAYIPLLEQHFDTKIDQIYLAGGGKPSGSDPFSWWNKVRTSIWNRSVVKMEPRTTIGSLLTASLAANLFDGVSEASTTLFRSTGIIEPDPNIHEAYADKRDAYVDQWEEMNHLYSSFLRHTERG